MLQRRLEPIQVGQNASEMVSAVRAGAKPGQTTYQLPRVDFLLPAAVLCGIYTSLTLLVRGRKTKGTGHGMGCQEGGSNTRPPELQSVALPAELSRRCLRVTKFADYMNTSWSDNHCKERILFHEVKPYKKVVKMKSPRNPLESEYTQPLISSERVRKPYTW